MSYIVCKLTKNFHFGWNNFQYKTSHEKRKSPTPKEKVSLGKKCLMAKKPPEERKGLPRKEKASWGKKKSHD